MTQYLEIHLMTKYGISNVNRNELGFPKTVEINGSVRPRISSQAMKYAWRNAFSKYFEPDTLGVRTKLLGDSISLTLLETEAGISKEEADRVAIEVISIIDKRKVKAVAIPPKGRAKGKAKPAADVAVVEDDVGEDAEKTDEVQEGKIKNPTQAEQLLFLSRYEIDRAIEVAREIYKGQSASEFTVMDIMSLERLPADIAMSGRMITKHPMLNVDAAVSVSHSTTTHQAPVEEDFFIGTDDWGSVAHLGERALIGGGVFYTYTNINLDLLTKNLGGDEKAARQAVRMFLRAMVSGGPRGMQTSFASYNIASYVLAERHSSTPFTSQGEFDTPVSAEDPLRASIERLRTRRKRLQTAHGITVTNFEFDPMADEGARLDALLDFAAGW